MRRGVALGVAVLLAVARMDWVCGQEAQPQMPATACNRPEQVDTVLINPGMGLFQSWGKPPAKPWEPLWVDDVVSLVYFRDVWADLEGNEGEYHFADYWDPAFEYWASKGKRICFGVMSVSMHSKLKYTTPEYVFKAGVPGVVHKGLYTEEQVEPVFWNPIYLDKLTKFIAALGQHYNGKPYLDFLDMRGIGEWGEMHMARWTTGEKREQGYTFYKYILAYRTMLDAYVKAFPDTRLALNMGDYPTIVDYAVSKRIALRLDGLTMNGPETGRRYFGMCSKIVPTIYEYCWGKKEIEARGENVPDTIANGLKDPISYMNLNFMSRNDLAKLPPGDPIREGVMTAARKVGYRLVVDEVHFRPILLSGEGRQARMWVKTIWRNLGVAPCYLNLTLAYSVCDEAGQVVHEELTFPHTPTTQWYPNQTITEQVAFNLPKGLKAGKYTLRLALFDPSKPDRKIQLGIAGRDDEGRYAVAGFEVKAVAPPAQKTFAAQIDFEDGQTHFHAHKGVTCSLESCDGRKCLAIRGAETGGYNYAHGDMFPLLPFCEYKLSCRMKVKATKDGEGGPYLKCAVHRPDKSFYLNHSTGCYDLGKMDTWQTLEAYFETDDQAASGLVAVEKGTTTLAEVDMELDDIRVELLVGP